MHDAEGCVAPSHQPGFLGQLSTGAIERVLALVAGACRHLPRGLIPGMPPLPHKDRVAVGEMRDDERRVRVGDDCVRSLGSIGKPDDVAAEGEEAGPGDHLRITNLEGPAALRVRETVQRFNSCRWTTAATAAAAAAM